MKRSELLHASSLAGIALNVPREFSRRSVGLLDLRFVAEVRGQHIGGLKNVAAVIIQSEESGGPRFYNIPRPPIGQNEWRLQEPPMTPVTDVSFTEGSVGEPVPYPEKISVAVNVDGIMYLTPYRVVTGSYIVAINPQGPHFYTRFLPFSEKTHAIYRDFDYLRVVGPNLVVTVPIMTTQLELELQSKG